MQDKIQLANSNSKLSLYTFLQLQSTLQPFEFAEHRGGDIKHRLQIIYISDYSVIAASRFGIGGITSSWRPSRQWTTSTIVGL